MYFQNLPLNIPSPSMLKKDFDNLDTFQTLTQITEKNVDRLYYIVSEDKYYRYNENSDSFVVAIDFTEINNKISILQANGVTTNTRIDTTNSRVSAAEGNIQILHENILDIDAKLTITEEDVDSLETRALNIESKVLELENEIDSKTTDINGLKTRVTNVENLNTTQTNDITDLKTRVTSVEGVNTTQNTNITNLQTRATNIETVNTTQNTNITNLQTRATTIEGVNTTQTNDITALQTRATNIESVNTTQNTNITNLQTSLSAKQDNLFTTALMNAPGQEYQYQLYAKNVAGTWYKMPPTAGWYHVLGDMVFVSINFRIGNAVDNTFLYPTDGTAWLDQDGCCFNLPIQVSTMNYTVGQALGSVWGYESITGVYITGANTQQTNSAHSFRFYVDSGYTSGSDIKYLTPSMMKRNSGSYQTTEVKCCSFWYKAKTPITLNIVSPTISLIG